MVYVNLFLMYISKLNLITTSKLNLIIKERSAGALLRIAGPISLPGAGLQTYHSSTCSFFEVYVLQNCKINSSLHAVIFLFCSVIINKL